MDNNCKWVGQTTDATPKELFRSDNTRLAIATGAVYRIEGTALAVDASVSAREWQFSMLIKNVAGTVSFIGSPIVTDLRGDTGTESWVLSLTADNTNKALSVTVTGESAHSISWSVEAVLNAVGDTNPAISGYYCDDNDIEYMIGEKMLAQLSNDTTNALTPDNTVVIACIQKAQAYIDAELGGTYSTPFAPVPEVIKSICVTLSIYYLLLRRFSIMEMPKGWTDERDKAIKQIGELSTLEQRLDPDLYPVLSASAVMMQAVYGDRVMDFSSTSIMGNF